jgi:hypothetical protein
VPYLSDRKLRLFACACYRRLWGRLHPGTRTVVAVAEQFADGRATADDLQIAVDSAWSWPQNPSADAAWVASALAREAAERSAQWAAGVLISWGGPYPTHAAEGQAQCALLRDLAGDPFGPAYPPFKCPRCGPTFWRRGAAPDGAWAGAAPYRCAMCGWEWPGRVQPWLAWDGGAVPRLAQGIDADGAFERLPVLADALEEAGCTDAAILAHCREPGPHVRGCWVVDLLLGKE